MKDIVKDFNIHQKKQNERFMVAKMMTLCSQKCRVKPYGALCTKEMNDTLLLDVMLPSHGLERLLTHQVVTEHVTG